MAAHPLEALHRGPASLSPRTVVQGPVPLGSASGARPAGRGAEHAAAGRRVSGSAANATLVHATLAGAAAPAGALPSGPRRRVATLGGRRPAGAPPAAPRGPLRVVRRFGKYREIVAAVALFLLLDLGVLALNFTIAAELARDAVGINLAGRQRMLSQRIAKSLLSLETGVAPAADRRELAEAAALFDDTLRAFAQGGAAVGGDGTPVTVSPLEAPEALAVLQRARTLWEPYRALLLPVQAGTADAQQLAAAVAYARGSNVELLGLMNGLTTSLEHAATRRSSTLRAVQAVAIVLALLNFVVILLKFVRRLDRSDAAAEAAAAETRRILHTVNEGLLLVDRRGRIGRQMSSSVPRLFGRAVVPGQDFIALLEPMIEPNRLADAREFLHLMFSPHVRASLMRDLNPLGRVEARVINRLGDVQRRWLSFDFARAGGGGGGGDALLVTVQDVTASVELERALNDSRNQAGIELGVLADMLANDRGALLQFVARAKAGLLEINRLLESGKALARPDELHALVDRVARRVHAIKGDAAALRLTPFVTLAADFEEQLAALRATRNLDAEALLAVPLPLDDLLLKVKLFGRILTADVDGAGGPRTERGAPVPQRLALESAVREAARDLGKLAHAQVDVSGLAVLPPAAADLVQDLLMQLVRNAVAHGIEIPERRVAAGKLSSGLVQVWCRSDGGRMVEVGVRDDGNGIVPQAVRARLVATGQLSEDDAARLADAQVVQLLLQPGVSTTPGGGAHAGRGLGLDLVSEAVRTLGAHLRVLTRPQRFTEFNLRFSL